MGFDYNFDRDTKHVTIPESGKRRRWMFAGVFTVILVGLVMFLRPSSESGSASGGEAVQPAHAGADSGAGNGSGGAATGADAVAAQPIANFSAEQAVRYSEAEGLFSRGDAVKAAAILAALVKEFKPYSNEWEKARVAAGQGQYEDHDGQAALLPQLRIYRQSRRHA